MSTIMNALLCWQYFEALAYAVSQTSQPNLAMAGMHKMLNVSGAISPKVYIPMRVAGVRTGAERAVRDIGR